MVPHVSPLVLAVTPLCFRGTKSKTPSNHCISSPGFEPAALPVPMYGTQTSALVLSAELLEAPQHGQRFGLLHTHQLGHTSRCYSPPPGKPALTHVPFLRKCGKRVPALPNPWPVPNSSRSNSCTRHGLTFGTLNTHWRHELEMKPSGVEMGSAIVTTMKLMEWAPPVCCGRNCTSVPQFPHL